MHSILAEDGNGFMVDHADEVLSQTLSDAGPNEAQPGLAEALALTPEDQARADFYALIARLLIAPPDAHLLSGLARADSLASLQTDNPLDLAWEKLVLTAGVMDIYAVEEEFNELFISVSNPKVNPNASLYLAGFLHEKPLAALRTELAHLGLGRASGVGETEDHLAALCETMRILITESSQGRRHSVQRQKLFFEKNILSWANRCLDDIRTGGGNFYRQVADFAEAFFSIEAQAFDMEEL